MNNCYMYLFLRQFNLQNLIVHKGNNILILPYLRC